MNNYDYGQNGCYFVTVCTQNRKAILSKIVGDDAHIVPKNHAQTKRNGVGDDAHIVPQPQLLPCGKIVEKYIRNAKEIEKYVIMPDHIHLIIRIDNGTMWASSPTANKVANIVRSLKTLSTKEYGKPIFQRSYYDHIIRDQNDYNEKWEYIENNPAKWILTKNA